MFDTSSAQSDLYQGFIRQRRNLIIISLVLVFVQVSGLDFERISVLGAVAKLEHASAVDIALWIGWAYWLLRYGQFFHDLENRGIKSAYHEKLRELVPQAILKDLIKNNELDDFEPHIDPKTRRYEIFGLTRKSSSPYSAGLTVQIVSADGNTRRQHAVGEHRITPDKVRLERALAALYVAFRTRMGTEFILPFVIAGLPIVGAIISNWPTSMTL